MTNDRLSNIEKRLQLIEAFLDAEMRQRQHLANLQDVGGHGGPVNPWYGCSLGVSVEPIHVGPVRPKTAVGVNQTVAGNVAGQIGADERHAVEDVEREARDGISIVAGIVREKKDEGASEA